MKKQQQASQEALYYFRTLTLVCTFGLLAAASRGFAESLPLKGIEEDDAGVAAFNTQSGAEETQKTGHILHWFSEIGLTRHAYYYLASQDHVTNTTSAVAGFGDTNRAVTGFANLSQALTQHGLDISAIALRHSLASLGGDVEGVDWNYDSATKTETRVYQGGDYQLVLKDSGQILPLVGGAMPTFKMLINYGVLTVPGDDQISGLTAPASRPNWLLPFGASQRATDIANAILDDIDAAGGGLRFVFDSLQPSLQTDIVASNRVIGLYEIQQGSLELVALPLVDFGDASVDEGDEGLVAVDVPLTLSEPSQYPVTIRYYTSGNQAYDPADYVHTNGTIVIEPGVTTTNVTVYVKGDTLREGNENFSISLASDGADGARIDYAVTPGTVTIRDDDGAFIGLQGIPHIDGGLIGWDSNGSGAEPQSPTVGRTEEPSKFYSIATPDFMQMTNFNGDSYHGGLAGNVFFGFPQTTAELTSRSIDASRIKLRFGPANLGGMQAGNNYEIQGTNLHRYYRGGEFAIRLDGEDLLVGQMPTLTLTEDTNGVAYQKTWHTSQTEAFILTNATSPETSADGLSLVSALQQDIGSRALRLIMENVMESSGMMAVTNNGNEISFFEVANARLELVAGVTNPAGQVEIHLSPAFVAEGDSGSTFMEFQVSLSGESQQEVTVNYTTEPLDDDAATEGIDYVATSGTLTFSAAITNVAVSVTILGDTRFESNEAFRLVFSNPSNGTLIGDTVVGVILNDDIPSFPSEEDDFETDPDPLPAICTPMAGIYNTNLTEIWMARTASATPLLRVAAVAVSTNEASTVEAVVYDTGGTMIGSNQVSYTVAELVANGNFYTKWVDIPFSRSLTVGEQLAIHVRNLPPTPLSQTHYRLEAQGVRWMATPSPSFAGFEEGDVRWRFRVLPGETNLFIDFFTNNLPNWGTIDFRVLDPTGNEVLTNSVAVGPWTEIQITNAVEGLWTLEMYSHEHYRIAKTSGMDTAIYADWRTASYGQMLALISLDGAPAFGTPFNVQFEKVDLAGGATNYVPVHMEVTTNGTLLSTNIPHGRYRISVSPGAPGVSTPEAQEVLIGCGDVVTNHFAAVSGDVCVTALVQRLPIIGLQGANAGVAAFMPPAPQLEGHLLPWLPQIVTITNEFGTFPNQDIGPRRAYYNIASRDHITNDTSVVSGFGNNAQPLVGFANLSQALTLHGLDISAIGLRHAVASLGNDVEGEDWRYDPASTTETRRYRGGSFELVYRGATVETLVGGDFPDLILTIRYNDTNNIYDDEISGTTAVAIPQPALVHDASQVAQDLATAIMADAALYGGGMRLVFGSLQPSLQGELNYNGRRAGIFEIQEGSIELTPASFDFSLTPLISLRHGKIIEPDAGQTQQMQFAISLSHPTDQPVTFEFATQDNGPNIDAGVHYDAVSQVFVIPAGDTSLTVTVPAWKRSGRQGRGWFRCFHRQDYQRPARRLVGARLDR